MIIGPSGSGKSSLAYETIGQIGQHEFMSMFADNVSEPTYKVKSFFNMVVAIPIKQSNFNNNLRSTIGTYFGINRSIGFIYSILLDVSEDLFILNRENNLCEHCHGLGTISVLDINRIINYNIPLEKNPFRCWNKYKDFYLDILIKYCNDCGIDPKKTFKELSKNEMKKLLYEESKIKYKIKYKKINSISNRTTKFKGVMTEKKMLLNHSIGKKFYSEKECPYCQGKKYSQLTEKYKILNLSIGEFMTTPFLKVSKILKQIINEINDERLLFTLKKINNFVHKAIELNLGHLYFHRAIPTLSGGELQRLKMVQVFNTQLSDLLIILDEPLAGLSGKEKKYLYQNIVELSRHHTIILVDHSEEFINIAENIITLGKGGGNKGGFIVNIQEYLKSLKNNNDFNPPKVKKIITINIENQIYEYKGVNICIAEKCMNLITGYSGIGKSTLLREYFPQYFENYSYISQKSLLGNKNSSVATALNISSKISELFAKKFSKDKKFFSNLSGNDGACPTCQGAGYLEYGNDRSTITKLECQECDGTGFNKNLKKYKIEEKNIFDIWNMTISEAILHKKLYSKNILEILDNASSIMLGHLKIGQPTASLSGGENVRIKILKSLKTTSNIIGIDEPFKGLNQLEIYKVIKYIDSFRHNGKTIVIIDHTENINKYFSKIIELKNQNNILIGN